MHWQRRRCRLIEPKDLTPFAPRDWEGDSLTYRVYRAIKEDILFGRLQIGEKLNIVRLAEQHNVSRTPVKRALELLERDGLIEVAVGKQARVKPPSVQEITSIYLFRRQLEPVMAMYSVKRIPEEELLFLKERLLALESNPELHMDSIDFDGRIHTMLWRHLHSPMVNAIFQIINDYSVRIQSYTTYSVQKISTNNNEHMAIIDAGLERDGERIREAVYTHLVRSCQRLLEYRKQENA